jgi:hypothetical protein
MSIQWHTLFGHLLKLQLTPHFQVDCEQQSSELPRKADVLVVRKRARAALPYRGLWTHLTAVNVMEYKSPEVWANAWMLTRLAHVGTGFAYRYHEQPHPELTDFTPEQLSLWLLIPRLTATLQTALTTLGFVPHAPTPGVPFRFRGDFS